MAAPSDKSRKHLVTFLVDVPEDLEEVDWDDAREQVGTGAAEIYNDESIAQEV